MNDEGLPSIESDATKIRTHSGELARRSNFSKAALNRSSRSWTSAMLSRAVKEEGGSQLEMKTTRRTRWKENSRRSGRELVSLSS